MNKEEFKSELSKLGISLTDTQLESLEKYANETHYNIGRNIREVIAFPMNSNAQDLLLGSPGEVTEQQLREVHIKLR